MGEIAANQKENSNTGYFISAPWRSSGKTIVTIGLARAAKRRNLAVQTFKKGPDFIDPLWLGAASGNGCYNIDPYIQQENQWQNTFKNHRGSESLALVEGTMGLHDGLQSDGSDSNASVAKALNLPVLLVVDCRGMHRTVAALVNGIQQFDNNVQFAGVILNRVRSARHEAKLQAALTEHSNIKILGIIPDTNKLHIDEKQLGLTPAVEYELGEEFVEAAADLVEQHCDLDSLFAGSNVANPFTKAGTVELTDAPPIGIKIGIARDEAFHFYYQDDLDAFARLGVELIEVSPLNGDYPADLDGLIVGGGFPERYAEALSNNRAFLTGLLRSVQNGLVVHAECAGLMYLCRCLVLEDHSFDMVGVIDGEVRMRNKPQGRGYMKLQHGDTEIRAHEFHHSEVQFNTPQDYLFSVLRGHGIDGKFDGVKVKNVHASYAHFRQTNQFPWVERFVQRVLDNRAISSKGGVKCSP